ncbi:MAG: MBL fold metallo-hydrolase [Gemmatimonadales bacterium]
MARITGLLLALGTASGLVVPVAAAQSAPAAPRELVRRAVESMGGEAALRGLRSTTIDVQNAGFGLGQEETPESPARAGLSFGRIHTEWPGPRRVTTFETRPLTGAIGRQRQVIRDSIGVNETNGQFAPVGPGAVAQALNGMQNVPERLLLRALDAPSALRPLPVRRVRGELVDGARFIQGPDTLSLYFDRGNGHLIAMERVTDDPVLGDRRTLTLYTRWQDAGGLKLPRQIDVFVNDRLNQASSVGSAVVNQPIADSLWVVPDSVAARAQKATSAVAPVSVTLNELAPGIWRAEGGTHFSLVVDQGSSLLVVEAPLGRPRFAAVLDTLRSRFPRKPVGTVVSTHHHWDHSGGVRTALAAGLPVVVHARNAGFVRGVAAARKTTAPDALSRTPRGAVVRSVTDSLSIGTGLSRVVLLHLPSAHADGILAAWVPAARILFVSDVLSPPAQAGQAPARAGSIELVALARAHGLNVDRVVGGHGGIAAWADVERAANGER